MFESIKLSDLPSMNLGVLRKPSNTRPAIWLVEENGKTAIVKDFSPNGFFYKNVIGRFLIWRESKAYTKLKGLAGVPTLYRTVDGLALVLEEIKGENLEKIEHNKNLTSGFFDDLKNLTDNFHACEVAHCDLKRAANVIIGNDGKPYIVDWAASISDQAFKWPLLNLIFRRFLKDDYMAITKLKLKYIPNLVSAEEKRIYEYRSGPEIIIRFVRDKLRGALKRIA